MRSRVKRQASLTLSQRTVSAPMRPMDGERPWAEGGRGGRTSRRVWAQNTSAWRVSCRISSVGVGMQDCRGSPMQIPCRTAVDPPAMHGSHHNYMLARSGAKVGRKAKGSGRTYLPALHACLGFAVPYADHTTNERPQVAHLKPLLERHRYPREPLGPANVVRNKAKDEQQTGERARAI